MRMAVVEQGNESETLLLLLLLLLLRLEEESAALEEDDEETRANEASLGLNSIDVAFARMSFVSIIICCC